MEGFEPSQGKSLWKLKLHALDRSATTTFELFFLMISIYSSSREYCNIIVKSYSIYNAIFFLTLELRASFLLIFRPMKKKESRKLCLITRRKITALNSNLKTGKEEGR